MMKRIKIKTVKAVCPVHGEFNQLQIGAMKQPCPKCNEEQKKKEVESMAEFRNMQIISGIKKRYINANLGYLENIPGRENMENTIKDYCTKFKKHAAVGRCLVVCGGVGIGKTYLLSALANALIKAKIAVTMCTLQEMLSDIISSYKSEKIAQERTLQKYTSKSLLILDEVEVKELTEQKNNIFFQVVNSRYNNILPTVIISNDFNILKKLDNRISDRLKENNGIFVYSKIESIRK